MGRISFCSVTDSFGLWNPLRASYEPAAWAPLPRSERVMAALETGLGKVEGSRLIALSTRGAGQSWFDRALDKPPPGAHVTLYEADRQRPFDWDSIEAANPDLTDTLRGQLARERERAMEDSTAVARWTRYRLNLAERLDKEAQVVSLENWQRCESDRPPEPAGEYILGLDLGGSASMAGASAYSSNGVLRCFGAFPHHPALATRGRGDGADYEAMFRRGELVLMGARWVPPEELLAECWDRWGAPAAIVADRFRQAELIQALEKLGHYPELIFRGQGWRAGGQDVLGFQKAVAEQRVKCAPNLALRMALSEAVIVCDTAGNWKLSRGSAQGQRRSRARDDILASTILAVAEGSRREASSPAPARRMYIV